MNFSAKERADWRSPALFTLALIGAFCACAPSRKPPPTAVRQETSTHAKKQPAADADIEEYLQILTNGGELRIDKSLSLDQMKAFVSGVCGLAARYWDSAMTHHYRGRYADSNSQFVKAEDLIDRAYTKSLIGESLSLVSDDSLRTYSGERFEQALSRVFHTLNYALLGDRDESLVEVRRLEAHLDSDARQSGPSAYRDDGFGRVVASLLYDDGGKSDDARISHEAALQAYAAYDRQGQSPRPRLAPPSIPAGNGEIVLIIYNGFGPQKVVERRGLLDVPMLKSQPLQILTSQLAAIDAAGHEHQADAQEMENVDWLAQRDLEEKSGRAKTRAAVHLLSDIIFGGKTAEKPDTRGWHQLPARVLMVRLPLPPGEYLLKQRFFGRSGRPITFDIGKIMVKKGRRIWIAKSTVYGR